MGVIFDLMINPFFLLQLCNFSVAKRIIIANSDKLSVMFFINWKSICLKFSAFNFPVKWVA